MKISIDLSTQKNIYWPNFCAFCNQKSESTAVATSSVGTGLYPGVWTERVRNIRYPICKKHKLKSKFVNIPGSLGFVRGVLLFLFSPIIYLAPILLLSFAFEKITGNKAPHPSEFFEEVILYGSYILNAAIYIYAKTNRAISISGEKDNKIIFNIKNADYANEFKEKNGIS